MLGAEAPAGLVAQLLALGSANEALAWLQPAVPAGLVEIRSGSRDSICFAHALVRDAVYAIDGARPRRRELHRRAAELLEPQAVGHDERAGAVARHWDQAGRPDLAVEWAVRAADAARAAGAYGEAATYLTLALAALDPRVGDARC